jgi:hypothetical protein
VIRAPFIRLALLALCSLYVLGLALARLLVGPWWMLAVALGGAALAFALSLSIDAEKPRRVTTRMK